MGVRVEILTFDDAMTFVGNQVRASGASGIDLGAVTTDRDGHTPAPASSPWRVWEAAAAFVDGHTVVGRSGAVESDHYAAIVEACGNLLVELGLATAAGRINTAALRSMRGGEAL